MVNDITVNCIYKRNKRFLILRILLGLSFIFGMIYSRGHNNFDEAVVDREKLMILSDSLQRSFYKEYEHSIDVARQRGISSEFITEEGVRYALQRIDNGLPVYYQTFNRGGAITSGASELQFGGSKLLITSGRGQTAGVWDAGMIYSDHQEFDGRVNNVNQARDFDDHATHVAGSIIAGGMVEQAKGMAYEGRVRGFDWNNDLSEMAAEAANGLLFSNHSYGFSLGWARVNGSWRWMGDSNADEDYRFGFYGPKSQTLDQIAFNAPYYLIVWAAGNDRNDFGDGSRPPDGPYDCIGPEGVAKNVLTVGAISGIPEGYQKPSDVVMTDFSSWGPADDGRVKPDLVTKGRNVYSTTLNNGYGNKSGTSMAAPIATGSLMLVQDFYHGISGGQYMKAATLKGLAIHTANQTGISPGPDYSFGWGLLDVGRMVDFLMHRNDERLLFVEGNLPNQAEHVYEFYSDGSEPITASVSWTDRPGTPVAAQLNPRDLMLVNDLDMRLIHEGGDTIFPWILDPDFPMAEAKQGDNFRDNIEKIYLNMPLAGNYRLVISHKRDLAGGMQDYSLFLQNGHLPQKKNLYWIGMDGNWNDSTSWSYSSGGMSAGLIPDVNHRVVIDRHSFTAEGQRLTLTEPAICYSMTVQNSAKGSIVFNEHALRIVSSMHAEKEFVAVETDAALMFMGSQRNNYIYLSNFLLNDKPNLNLIFDSRHGEWEFVSDLSAGRILVRQGSLNFRDVNIEVNELIVNDRPSIREVHPRAAIFSGLQKVDFPELRFSFNGDDATFIFESDRYGGEEQALFNTGGAASLGRLINNGRLSVNNAVNLDGLENHGALHLFGDMEVEFVSFSDSAGFFLHNNTTITIHQGFSGAGKPGSLVELTGMGINNGITGMTNRIFCLDYVDVRNVSASGQSVFNAGLNSVVENASGWLTMDCDQVLFADFSFTSPCRNSWTFFVDQSAGQVEEWSWQFGALDTSSQRNPIYTFNQVGLQWVELTVGTPYYSHSARKPVVIFNNPLPEPTIYVQDSIYFVDLSGYSYQWYRDGKPIPGATLQIYNNAENAGGVYTALISNSLCNRPSSNHITVGTREIVRDSPTVHIYPNPAREKVRIEVDNKVVDEVFVFDLSGKILLYKTPVSPSYLLDVSHLHPGVYLLRIVSDKDTSHMKLQISW